LSQRGTAKDERKRSFIFCSINVTDPNGTYLRVKSLK
jgi:hypothetical protein